MSICLQGAQTTIHVALASTMLSAPSGADETCGADETSGKTSSGCRNLRLNGKYFSDCREETWDIFYKTPTQPKTFRIDFYRNFLSTFPSKNKRNTFI
jgi:hypothetical protein